MYIIYIYVTCISYMTICDVCCFLCSAPASLDYAETHPVAPVAPWISGPTAETESVLPGERR